MRENTPLRPHEPIDFSPPAVHARSDRYYILMFTLERVRKLRVQAITRANSLKNIWS